MGNLDSLDYLEPLDTYLKTPIRTPDLPSNCAENGTILTPRGGENPVGLKD